MLFFPVVHANDYHMQTSNVMKKLVLVSLIALFLPLFSNICFPKSQKIKVVTTFTIIADMTRNVVGEHAEVESITKVGAEIHGYQPTPRDLIKAQGADLVLWNGLNLERWFQQFFSGLENVPSVVVSEGIMPIAIKDGEYINKPNPHAWMGLENALIYVDNIKNALIELDPSNSVYYSSNAENYKDRIIQTISPLRRAILEIPETRRWLVSCEGAFTYLIQDYGMNELYLWPINADAQGTPQQVRKVIDKVRENKIPAVFCESTVSQAPAKQVASETDSHYGGVLYVDSLTASDGIVPTYLDLLRVTSETILNGLMKTAN